MKKIELTRGYHAIVDDSDYDLVSKMKWYAIVQKNGRCYAATAIRKPNGKKGALYLHRLIMNPQNWMVVDHINNNGLDCTRNNMRVCTHAENMRNRKPHAGSSSKYKGVSWSKLHKKWEVHCNMDKQGNFLGLFKNEEDAARAYDDAASIAFGEFAKTNKMLGLLD